MATAEGSDKLLLSTLEVDRVPHLVSLTTSHIKIEGKSTTKLFKPNPKIIALKEVLAVGPDVLPGTSARHCTFTVHFLRRRTKRRLGNRTLRLACQDSQLCQTWVSRISEAVRDAGKDRPKRLLVFVNPYGGKKEGPQRYKKTVAPLFRLAEIHAEVIETTRRNHAKDHLLTCDLSHYDGVVGVGGDGTFSEILNGLMERSLQEAGISQTTTTAPVPPKLKIGIIPAGSTDAIVYSTVGINDPLTSALQIIVGDTLGLDVCSVYHEGAFLKYSVSFVGYGYYGDVLRDSEDLRWMGPNRYKWCGFTKFLGNRSYSGKVSFLPSGSETHAQDGMRCTVGCSVCESAISQKTDEEDTEGTSESSAHSESKMAAVTSSGDGCGKVEGKFIGVKEGASESSAESESKMAAVTSSGDGWCEVEGKFIGVNAVSIPCRNEMAPQGVSPSCHLGDGTLDLMLVHDCSRVNYFRHLLRIAEKNADQFNFDFVRVHRVKEFRFEAMPDPEYKPDGTREQLYSLTPRTSVWNCDGEVLDQPNLHVRVHCQLIKLFARGIDP